MKTQKKFFLTVVLFFIVGISQATVIDTIYVTGNTNPETHNICINSINDSVMLHCPIGHTNIGWKNPLGQSIYDQDFVFISNSTQGHWRFKSDELGVWKDIYVYLVFNPYEPVSMANDTSVCTTSFLIELEAENPGSTYLWSTGATTVWYDAITTGTYTVTVTNTCGTGVYSKTITYNNPNAPHLGADQTFCWGSSTVLDPGSTNVATYQWSTGESTPTIMVDTTGNYWVYLVDNNGCNGRDTIEITTLVPTPEEVCFVEFDTATWKNSINWTSNLPGNAASIDVYKEGSLNVWNFIGTVAVGTTSFIDMNSTPQSNSNSYRIAIVDTCGNESTKSSPHTTITLISSYDPLSNTYGFSWSAYQGLTVADYFLFGIDSNNTVTQIASVTGNIYMYNYVNPNPGFVKYYIGFETPNCDAKTNVIVKSNWVDQDPLVTAIQHFAPISFSIYPNPSHDVIHLTLDNNDFQVEVTNILGQVVLHEHNTKVLNISSLPQGVYTISIIVDDIKSPKRFIKQ